MSIPLRVMILEDRPADAELMVNELRGAGFDPQWQRVESETEYLANLESGLDLILADYNLPQYDAMGALQRLQERGLDIPFLIITGSVSEEVAVECMKQGAADYLLKDRLARLGPAVMQALEQRRLRTERRQADERLRLQGAALDTAANAIVITDRDGQIAWVNRAFTRLTGYTYEDAWKQNSRFLKSGKHDVSFYRDMWDTILSGRVWSGELINRRKDGSLYTEEQTITPVRDQQGEISHFIAIKQDITDRKRAEEALRRYVERLKSMHAIDRAILGAQLPEATAEAALYHLRNLVPCQCVTVALFDFPDRSVTVLATSAANGEIRLGTGTRLSLDEFQIGENLRQGRAHLVSDTETLSEPPPLDLALHAKGVRAYMSVPLVVRGELIGTMNLGADTPGSFTAEHMDIAREVADQLAIAIQQARLHGAAARRGEELAALLGATRSIMSGLDLRGILDRIVAEAAAISKTPHVKVHLLDREAGVLRPGAFRGTAISEGHQLPLGVGLSGIVAATGEVVFSADTPNDPRNAFRDGDRALGILTYLGLPIKVRGEVVGVLTFNKTEPGAYGPEELAYLTSFADQVALAIENARLFEAVREHAASLEQRVAERTAELADANRALAAASRHKSEFLANMSHELRTPLNSIIGFSELLQGQGVGPLNEKQVRYLGHIQQAGKHLVQLIGDVLDIAKVEAGKIVLEIETLPVKETLDDLLVIARGLANKKGQTIETQIESDLPRLIADPVRFKQILFNLLSNAVKFTPDRGRITLTARRVNWSSSQKVDSSEPIDSSATRPIDAPGEWLELAVADTGIGIRPEDLSKLFQEFVQLKTTQAQRHEGTGLGLALTKRLVELHGGRIRAESEGEGRGTTFTILLPFEGPQG